MELALSIVGSAASKYLPKRTPWCLGLRPPTHHFLHDLSVCTVPAQGSSHLRLTWLGPSALSWALISSLGCLPGQVSSNSAFPLGAPKERVFTSHSYFYDCLNKRLSELGLQILSVSQCQVLAFQISPTSVTFRAVCMCDR